jgi:hypothetical protein
MLPPISWSHTNGVIDYSRLSLHRHGSFVQISLQEWRQLLSTLILSVDFGIQEVTQQFPPHHLPSLSTMVDDLSNVTPGFSVFKVYKVDTFRLFMRHLEGKPLFSNESGSKSIFNYNVAKTLLKTIANLKMQFGALVHLSYGLPAR